MTPATMFIFDSGSKIAPGSANFDRIGMSKAPPWFSGLMAPVALRKQMITKMHNIRHGTQIKKLRI